MMGIMGALELLPASETPEELQQYRHIATGSARDMMRLINNILVLSELRAGKLRLQAQRFSLRDTAVRLEQQFGSQARAKGLAFDPEFDGKLPDRVYGDGEKFEQSICHLLDNAVKFTSRGAVTLRYGGLGIGLAISRGLIEVFGGQLDQQSRPGLGSRFCIRMRFPLHDPERMPASQPNGSPPSASIA